MFEVHRRMRGRNWCTSTRRHASPSHTLSLMSSFPSTSSFTTTFSSDTRRCTHRRIYFQRQQQSVWYRPGEPSLQELRRRWVTWWLPEPAGRSYPHKRKVAPADAVRKQPEGVDHNCLGIFEYIVFPFSQPFGLIAEYFGLRSMLYFAWLSSYTIWLLLPAGLGIAVAALVGDEHVPSSVPLTKGASLQAAFCIFVTLWTVCFNKFWKREEAAIAAKFGTSDFERKAPLRPQFHGSANRCFTGVDSRGMRPDPITGHKVKYFPTLQRRLYQAFSTLVMIAAIAILITIFTAIIKLRNALMRRDGYLGGKSAARSMGKYANWHNAKVWGGGACSFAQAVLIQVLSALLRPAVDRLNEWRTIARRWRTMTRASSRFLLSSWLTVLVRSCTRHS